MQTRYSAAFKKGEYSTAEYVYLHKIPQEYLDLAQRLNASPSDFKIFSIPYSVINSPGWVNFPKWKVVGTDPTSQLFDSSIVGMNAYGAFGSWNYGSFWNHQGINESKWILPFAGLLNTRYIIYHKDIAKWFIKQTIGKVRYYEKENLITKLDENEYFNLYELNSRYFLPHLYSSSVSTVVFGDLEAMAPLAYTNYLNGKPAVFFTKQQGEKALERLLPKAQTFIFFNGNPLEERIRNYLKKAESPPTYFFSKELSGKVDSWEERTLKGSFYIPCSGDYFLRAKIGPQCVQVPDYGLKKKMDLKKWSFVPENVKYVTSNPGETFTVKTLFDGDAKESEYLLLKREIEPIDLEKYPNFELIYFLENPEVQNIEAILGIDLNNDGKADIRVSEQLLRPLVPVVRSTISIAGKDFTSIWINFHAKVIASHNLSPDASFDLVEVSLKISKADGLDCTTSSGKGWYKTILKDFGLFNEFNEDKHVKSRDYAFNERTDSLSHSFENLNLKEYPYVALIHQNNDPESFSVSALLYLDFDGDGRTDERVIREGITPASFSFNAFKLAKSEFPGKRHYYLTKLVVRIFNNPSVFLQHLQIYNEKILPYKKARPTPPVLKIDQKELSLTKSGSWYTSLPVYLREGYHDLDAIFPGIETKLDFIVIEPVSRIRDSVSGIEPEIIFQKVNPTKYRVKVKNAKEPFWLVFSESFHSQWRIYNKAEAKEDGVLGEIVADYPKLKVKEAKHLAKFTPQDIKYLFRKPLDAQHQLVNGYANAWYVEPNKLGLGEDFTLVIYFWPQTLFYLGLLISGLTLLCCIVYLLWTKKR